MDHEQRDDMLAVVRRQYPTPRSPRTEAGKQLVYDLDDFEGWDPTILDAVLAIEAEAAAPRSGEVEKAARAWVAEHRNGRTCTIVDCPTATALRAAGDATEVST